MTVDGGKPAGHLDGKIDAGGPYGGPGTLEGDTLTFTVTTSDPSILFFRWDFNNDSVFDFPDQTGGDTLGRWTTQTSVTRRMNDGYDGDIVVEGWDGISQRIVVRTGTNLGEPPSFQWTIGYGGWNFAWQFRANADMNVTQLGHHHYVYPLYDQGIWTASGTLLGSCTPTHVQLRWNWCTLPSPVPLFRGEDYRISIRPHTWMTAIDPPGDTDKVEFEGAYYCFSPSVLCFPGTFWTAQFIPLIDFRWQVVDVLPDPARDTANLFADNVAPSVSGITTDPSPGLEGSATRLTATFDDPGPDDTWEYRWTFGDGTDSGWRPVPKVTGGARVLILHSWTETVEPFRTNLAASCGDFCVAVDELDFGPLGENRVPSLDELRPYDVVLVGTYWGRIPNPVEMGNRLADFMDAAGATGGGVVGMFASSHSSDIWGIGGRWNTSYSPIPRSDAHFATVDLGPVYVPGHPILAGVSSLRVDYHAQVNQVTPGGVRVADFTDGHVAIATKENPIVPNGARAVALPWLPILSSQGDVLRTIANAVRWASRQPELLHLELPALLPAISHVYADDHPSTTTPDDLFPVGVEVKDDDGGTASLGSSVTIANVEPTAIGGFDSGDRDANGTVEFRGFEISDPALDRPSEWFAYAWDFGDGTPLDWVYKGNLVPPRFDVLVVHSLCISGNACAEFATFRNTLLALDDVGSVSGFNFLNGTLGYPQAPGLTLLLNYDVIVVAMKWGYVAWFPWDLARRQLGDRLAQYLDAGAGGVLTVMTTFDTSPTSGDTFALRGRYVDDDYGPFERASVRLGDTALGTIHDTDHEVVHRIHSGNVTASGVHSGDYATTVGGGGVASGRNGTLLADWADGASAIGVKELTNGMRTAHLGAPGTPGGSEASWLLRSLVGWVAGGIPTPKIPTVRHQFGNNPPYAVDLMLIDDDMGWTWNFTTGEPDETLPPGMISHRSITIYRAPAPPRIAWDSPDVRQITPPRASDLDIISARERTGVRLVRLGRAIYPASP